MSNLDNAGLISRLLLYYRKLLDNYLEINNLTIHLIPLIKILRQALYSLAVDLRKYISMDHPNREKIFDLQYKPHLSEQMHNKLITISKEFDKIKEKFNNFSNQFEERYESLKPLIPELNSLRKDLLFIEEFTLGEYIVDSPIKIQALQRMPYRRKDYLFEILILTQNINGLLEDLYNLERQYQFLEDVDEHLRIDYPYLTRVRPNEPGLTNQLKQNLEAAKNAAIEVKFKMDLLKKQLEDAQLTLKAQESKAAFEHELQLMQNIQNILVKAPQQRQMNSYIPNFQPQLSSGSGSKKNSEKE